MTSSKLKDVFGPYAARSAERGEDKVKFRKHIPLIASPLENHNGGEGHAGPQYTPLQRDQHAAPSFKHRHESSSIELFYDLFFVANLATFTENHEITDASTLRSYLGFFSLMWVTWFQTSSFDVRFATDSFYDRVCKALHFMVMIGFAITGAEYDTDKVGENLRSFQGLAIVLMGSRIIFLGQYAAVFWYVKDYSRTYIPLLASVAMFFVSAVVYLGTFFGLERGNFDMYVVWYVFAGMEVVVIIAVSSIWRVLSFKRTHLVERIGLLTLIIMGEGILGVSKAVSKILKTSTTVGPRDGGVILSAVLLIYFIYILYFDQIGHDRFGTIRMQIWAVLHYPLHAAILFTVEGSTGLIIWNILSPILEGLTARFRAAHNFELFNSTEQLVSYVAETINHTSHEFKETKNLGDFFNYDEQLRALANISAPYASAEFNTSASEIITDTFNGMLYTVLAEFGIEGTEKEGEDTTVESASDNQLEVFGTVFTYFYVAAGLLLVALAVLYAVGNARKTASEWASVCTRVVFGILVIIPLTGILVPAASDSVSKAAFDFFLGPWHIIIVMLVYFVVIVIDNIMILRSNSSRRRLIMSEDAVSLSHERPKEEVMESDSESNEAPIRLNQVYSNEDRDGSITTA